MLHIYDQKYFDSVLAFAEKIGKKEQLQQKLDYLKNYACGQEGDEGYDPTKTKCYIGKDFAPYSFAFSVARKDKNGEYQYWFNGGLIFHGNHDSFGSGAAPSFSVTLNKEDGWSIHT